jgi:hypothetical protein
MTSTNTADQQQDIDVTPKDDVTATPTQATQDATPVIVDDTQTPTLPPVLRTARNGCFAPVSNAWGTYISAIDDPDANFVMDTQVLKEFELKDGIGKIPADLWQSWIALCFHFVEKTKTDLEVSCRFLRREDDKSVWRILIPPQSVSGGNVRVDTFDNSIDIATGEVIESYPPPGWIPCGSAHSHNTMGAFWSSTDDGSELGDPGLHIVCGSIKTSPQRTYVPRASVTANKRRFEITPASVVDLEPVESPFHPSVLDIIDATRTVWTQTVGFNTGTTAAERPWVTTVQIMHPKENRWITALRGNQIFSVMTYSQVNKGYVDLRGIIQGVFFWNQDVKEHVKFKERAIEEVKTSTSVIFDDDADTDDRWPSGIAKSKESRRHKRNKRSARADQTATDNDRQLITLSEISTELEDVIQAAWTHLDVSDLLSLSALMENHVNAIEAVAQFDL